MKNNRPSGFTLIEVIISIAIFSIVMVAVFYFYSNTMNNQEKIREKYTILRISREFIDSFTANTENWVTPKGSQDKENFILQWEMNPVEDGKEIIFTSGRAPVARLHMVHLWVIKKETGNAVMELDFLYNHVAFK